MPEILQRKQGQSFYDLCEEKMQMLPEERQFLKEVLQNRKSFLEIGTGYSTLWCSQFVQQVASVEARRPWFEEIESYLKKYGIDNVDLHLLPPEPCAYYDDGREKWNNRDIAEGSDYGLTEEFTGYLEGIEQLIDNNHFDVVLVDGHVRKQIIEMLSRKRFKGIILLHDVMPERDYLNRPILALNGVKIINQVKTFGELAVAPYKLEVGGQRYTPGWITTDKPQLDVTNVNDWRKWFKPISIKTIFAEHILEHMSSEETECFLESAYEYLCEGGRIRIAVPDALHPSAWYHELCKPGGLDLGSDDHKYFFSCKNIYKFFDPAKYDIRLLEWWDEEGFHKAKWQNDDTHGKVMRSSEYYDGRITKSTELQKLLRDSTPECMRSYYSQYGITYTSLIFELVKKEAELSVLHGHSKSSGKVNISNSPYPVTIKTMDERVLDVPQLPPGNSSGTLNKIIGFCITKKDINFDFAFKKHFPWLSFEKLRVGSWFVHLWGHGSFAPFIREDNTTAIIVGYTQQELNMLGRDRLENRGVFIRISKKRVEIENDTIGSFRVFYGQGQDNVSIASVEDLVLQNIGRQPIDKTNLIQYLLLGHLTGEQTVYPHIFTMKANSLLHCNGMGFETQPLAPLHFRNSKNPVDELYMITVSTIRRYTDGYEKLFIPLSGGYDSRMLAACVEQPERITARTYDYAYPIEFGYEVSRARAVAEAAGIEDWDWCDLGSDFTADYGRRWFDIFGTSHHLHGMYVLSFFDKVFDGELAPLPTLSGYIGDVFVGHQLAVFAQVRNDNYLTKFRKAQYQGQYGFSENELKQLLNYPIDALLPVIYERWQKIWLSTEGQEYQRFILNFARQRGRSHVSYLCTIADLYGAAITPFTDRLYIETILGLPYKFLLNRAAQEQVFQKYLPSFWLDESELPEYKHCMNFLCMHKRGLDNIFPIVSDDSVRSHLLFRPEAVNQCVQEFTERCNSKKLIYSHKIIRSLYRLNILQPLFYADYLKGTESECAELGRKRDLISCHKESETDCVGVKVSVFSAQEFFRKGVIQLRSGNNTEALDYFNQARSLCSNMPEVHFAFATAYAQLGNLYLARKACEMELAIQPKHEGAKRLLERIEKALNESVSICEPNIYMVNGTTNSNIFGIRSEIEKHRLPGTEQPVPEGPRQHHVEKNTDNLKLQRIGSEYGGWAVELDLIPYGSTVISAGVGEDISFDSGLINLKNCKVIGIDPTEKARRYIENNKNEHFDFLQKALYSESNKKIRIYKNTNPNYVLESITPSHKSVSEANFYEAESISIEDILNKYKNVSVLKMDIEGAEYEVLNSISKLDIPQICIEFHHFCTDFTPDDTTRCIKHLNDMGYVVVYGKSLQGALKDVTLVHRKYVSEEDVFQIRADKLGEADLSTSAVLATHIV